MAYGKFASVYDRLMADMPYQDWIRFAEECFRRYGKPRTLADLGCGTGSIAIPLAGLGCRVYGIDLSEEMLAIAREKSDRTRRQSGFGSGADDPMWLQQDMREWELDEPVDAVVSFCDSVNYLTEQEDVAELFARTYEGLKPGGWFAFDVHTPGTLEEYAENQPFVLNEPDIAYIWLSALEEETCTIEHELTFFVRDPADGKFSRFREIHEQRAYPLKTLRSMLEEAGFGRITVYSDFGWDETDEDTRRAFFVAVKVE
ncbi:class I SAM-dependent DNA methyltransferase [Gorillibacterium sp. sgz5001074]|uniref:class I SAM-dependent DNA methyltransferase n=1 Tax=Gorillibacterium sp. sgz5001074 TaxID=3446695 RepID=UPI003F66116E